MINLSKHFTLDEMTRSSSIFDNTPNEHIIENLKHTCSQLEKVRELLGDKPIVISSGFRSREVNISVNGAKNSDHLWGFAVDFRVSGLTPYEIVEMISKSDIPFKQIINEFQSWTHLSFEKGNDKCQVLTASKVKGKTVYAAGNHK